MDLKKISDDIQESEGIKISNDSTLEDEVMRLILKYAYNIEYVNPLEDNICN